ncbi:sigma-E factor negative regulatory protein [Massilia atriviolacea]|uniref:sigma-E factor negative regulatory protein n=1 Tax=Massilia atriviolacea TaxID=2495579 RepID=UPI003857E4F2
MVTLTVMELSMDIPKTIREKISAFSDHELSPSTLPDDALRSAEGEHAWHAYHRIRDVIREQGAPHLSADFAGKLAARLAAEPSPGRRLARAPAEALERRALRRCRRRPWRWRPARQVPSPASPAGVPARSARARSTPTSRR